MEIGPGGGGDKNGSRDCFVTHVHEIKERKDFPKWNNWESNLLNIKNSVFQPFSSRGTPGI